jgi:hypothetical protein
MYVHVYEHYKEVYRAAFIEHYGADADLDRADEVAWQACQAAEVAYQPTINPAVHCGQRSGRLDALPAEQGEDSLVFNPPA